MPSWNGPNGLLVFNDSIIQGSQAIREEDGKTLKARSSQVWRQFTVNRYWTVDLSGLQLQAFQLRELRALEAEIGFGGHFLLRLSSYCLMEDEILGEHNYLSYTPTLLGTGAGTFPLVKRTSIQDKAPRIDRILYPNYDYPPLIDLNGETWTALPPLRVWQGAPVFNEFTREWAGNDVTGDCTIQRIGGTVTKPSGTHYVTGGFRWKMWLPKKTAVKPLGASLYEVSDGIQMLEPMPEGGEVTGGISSS